MECKLCSMDFNCVEVETKLIHQGIIEDLFNEDDDDEKVYLCENCRAMDCKCKLGTDIFSHDIIRQVEKGLYVTEDYDELAELLKEKLGK